MAESNGFTETQKLLLRVLSDGEPHSKEELMQAVDPLCTLNNLRVHLHHLRPRLLRYGQTIVCEMVQGRFFYRHVRLLAGGAGDGDG